MFRMSNISDYGLRLVLALSRLHDSGVNHSARDLARITGLPRPIVSKVLKILSREEVLCSYRGVNGGYQLSQDPHRISVGQVLRALEGPILIKGCLEEDSVCGNIDRCTVRLNWSRINRSIGEVLDSVSLPDLMAPTNDEACVQISTEKAGPAAIEKGLKKDFRADSEPVMPGIIRG
jgi:FeS assembly SUF system regulator